MTHYSKRKNGLRLFSFLLAFSLILAALFTPGAASAVELKKVRLIPEWLPQAQFAGYMIALEKGFYREAGLDVEILNGGPGRLPLDLLESHRAEFGVAWLSSALARRSRGLKIVNVAQIFQRSSLVFVAKRENGVNSPQDLEGRNVGLWVEDFRVTPIAFLKKLNLTVNIIPQYYSINLFLRDGVTAAAAMYYNEYDQMIESGYDANELTVFRFNDYGLDFPEDGLYCLESTYEKDPEMCRLFAEASIKGWAYAASHKDETLEIVLKNMDGSFIGANRAHQGWMLNHLTKVISKPGHSGIGRLRMEDYKTTADLLKQLGLIENIDPFEDFYRGLP